MIYMNAPHTPNTMQPTYHNMTPYNWNHPNTYPTQHHHYHQPEMGAYQGQWAYRRDCSYSDRSNDAMGHAMQIQSPISMQSTTPMYLNSPAVPSPILSPMSVAVSEPHDNYNTVEQMIDNDEANETIPPNSSQLIPVELFPSEEFMSDITSSMENIELSGEEQQQC